MGLLKKLGKVVKKLDPIGSKVMAKSPGAKLIQKTDPVMKKMMAPAKRAAAPKSAAPTPQSAMSGLAKRPIGRGRKTY